MAQEALGFMQNSKEKNLDFIEILSKEPDNRRFFCKDITDRVSGRNSSSTQSR